MLPESAAVDLRLTGEPDPSAPLVLPARSAGMLVHVGHRSEAELAALYAGARAYVHPALREGFGLPLLEAMRAGAPVIAARGALPAVLAPYAHAFEAEDAVALRDLLWRALCEPDVFRDQARAAQTATRELTWERTVRATADIYREFLA